MLMLNVMIMVMMVCQFAPSVCLDDNSVSCAGRRACCGQLTWHKMSMLLVMLMVAVIVMMMTVATMHSMATLTMTKMALTTTMRSVMLVCRSMLMLMNTMVW